MIFTFGNHQIDIDLEKTREFYSVEHLVSDACGCDGCRNYEKATEQMPQEVKDFFNTIGADIRKPAEVFVNYAESEGKRVYYGGFYHLCGTIVQGENAWTPVSENQSYWEPDNSYQLAENYRVSFETECDLVADSFPRPVIQVEIDFHVPWVLDTENTYE